MTANNWNNFEDDEPAKPEYRVIPKGTMAKVIMIIEPGGHNNTERSWTGGFATRNRDTGSVYLKVKFVILEGEYARRQIWGMIGLHSEKGPTWGQMGSTFIRGIVSSARNVGLFDKSLEAKSARQIKDFAELEALEFVALIDVVLDKDKKERNVINKAITCEHKDYAALMNDQSPPYTNATQPVQPTVPEQNVEDICTEWKQ